MPARNRLKEYVSDAWYHVYNRGINKERVFLDDQDYAVFLSYLKTYLTPKDEKILSEMISNPSSSWRDKAQAVSLLRLNNFFDSINLAAYCLMPNHFHFLIRQGREDAMDSFMNSLCTRYSMFFNKKRKRVGPVFQGVYKAVRIMSDEQFIHVSRYIHRNPIADKRKINLASQGLALRSYFYSSYPVYLELRECEWVETESVRAYFAKDGTLSYPAFVEESDTEYSEIITHGLKLD